MLCIHCQTINPDSAKFCMNCGQPLGAAKLSEEANADSLDRNLRKYIPDDLLRKLNAVRANRSMEGERRIVTMLFCDVKGSTAMAETLDPEAWVEIMNRVFEYMIAPVYKYEGTIARLMGDAILAFFGAPIAHEDDPQRAALAGLDIVQGIRHFRDELARTRNLQFDVRVGINTGLVVVGEVGSDMRVEYTAMGDAVNLAARMEQTAQPGTVQISGNTAKLIAPLFDLQSLGGIEVKGKKEPVPAFAVLRPKPIPGRLRGIEGLYSPLIGRDREFTTIRGCLESLAEGHGQIVSVMAEAGIGKSRLIAEIRSTVDPSLTHWFEGRCVSFQGSIPYAPFIDLFTTIFGLRPEDSSDTKYGQIKALVAALVGEKAEEIAPFLASVIGVEPQGADSDRVRFLEPPAMRMGIFQAVQKFIQAFALSRPLVLVFEDLHWSDPTSLELLEQLMPITNDCPLLLMALYRAQQHEPSWHFHEVAARDYGQRYTPIKLEPLDAAQSRLLVANLLEIEDLPDKTRTLILNKSEGNPFFVEEVIRSLLDAELVVRDGDHWRATREINDIALPDTLAGVITARLDRLDDPSKRAAQTASVIGREFAAEVIHEIYESPSLLEPALINLQKRELIREKTAVPQPRYLFKHVLTQETAYRSLLKSKRRHLHSQVAESLVRLEPQHVNEIAHHFVEAEKLSQALPYLVAAGDNAARAYSSVEATSYYRKALEILKTVFDVQLAKRVYEGLGRILTLGGDMPGAAALYHDMRQYAEDHSGSLMKVSALNKLALNGLYSGQFEQIDAQLLESEQIARAVNDGPGLAELFFARCMICLGIADFNGAVQHLNEAVTVGHDLAVDEQVTFGLSHLANTMTFLTRFEDAWKTTTECVRIAEKIGDKPHLADVLGFPIPFYHIRNGDLEAAFQAAEKGAQISATIGYAFGQAEANFTLASLAQTRGEHEQALNYAYQSLDGARRSGYPNLIVMALSILGSAYLDISSSEMRDKVIEYHQQAIQVMQHPIGLSAGGTAWLELGYCVMQIGTVDQAADFFQKGLTIPTTQMLLSKPRFLIGLALVALERKEVEEGFRLIREAREYSEARGMKYLYPEIALVEAKLSLLAGKAEQSLEKFAEAESLALEMQMRPMVWQSRAGASQALIALGRPDEAAAKQQAAAAAIAEIAARFTDDNLRALYVKNATSKLGLNLPT